VSEPIDLGHLGLGPLLLVHGELEARSDDVLVTEANTALQMTSGIAGFLRKAGGIEIHKEAITQGPLPVGRVARTSPGQLRCKALYHAVLTDFFGRGMSAKVIVTILGELLGLAEEDGAATIAMPLFGGGGGLKASVALEAIVEGLEAADRTPQDALAITLVVRDTAEFVDAAELCKGLKAGDARRDEENDVAADYLAELMAEMGDLGDVGDIEFE
jgi:O-acetyl-ADP-ribose deacetylase